MTWSAPIQITTAATNETTAGANNFSYGDYSGLTGFGGRYFACWTDRRSGGSEEIWGAPLAVPSIRFVFGKSTFSKDEVSPSQSFSSGLLHQRRWVHQRIPGLQRAQRPQRPTGQCSGDRGDRRPGSEQLDGGADRHDLGQSACGRTFSARCRSFADDPTLNEELQSFFYPYTITFPADPSLSNLFGALNPHEVAFVTLTATFTVGQLTLTAKALIELAQGRGSVLPEPRQHEPEGLSGLAELRSAFLQGDAHADASDVQRSEPHGRERLHPLYPGRHQ